MPDITNARGYPIGEMSKRTGVNIETIRYYEQIGDIAGPLLRPRDLVLSSTTCI